MSFIQNVIHELIFGGISDSAMFLITGSSRSSLSSLRSDIRAADLSAANFNSPFIANGNSLPRPVDAPIKPGNIDAYDSLINLLDCAILYYYAVAHKYVIMVLLSITMLQFKSV